MSRPYEPGAVSDLSHRLETLRFHALQLRRLAGALGDTPSSNRLFHAAHAMEESLRCFAAAFPEYAKEARDAS